MIKDEIIQAFKDEFSFIQEKFEIINLLKDNSPINYDSIEVLRLPSDDYNIVWHPGVYVFIGNNLVYRVGVSMHNSRARVMQHLYHGTMQNDYKVWDIDQYSDKAILLFNIKERSDRHWLLALEVFLENKFNPLIKSKRIG